MTPEFCFIDIETAPVESFHWRAKTRYIPHDFNEQETTILCACAKFSSQKRVYYTSVHRYHKAMTLGTVRKDYHVVKDLNDLLLHCADQAIIVVYQNGDRFDLPLITGRTIYHRLPPIPKLVSVDTLKKMNGMGLDYRRQDYVDKVLHNKGKVETRGWLMWRDIVSKHSNQARREKAIKEMVNYCKGDIMGLERIFNTLRPYMKTFPNVNLWQGSQMHCPSCGGNDIIYRSKPWMARTQMYRRMSCKGCGHWFQEAGAMRDPKTNRVIKALVK